MVMAQLLNYKVSQLAKRLFFRRDFTRSLDAEGLFTKSSRAGIGMTEECLIRYQPSKVELEAWRLATASYVQDIDVTVLCNMRKKRPTWDCGDIIHFCLKDF